MTYADYEAIDAVNWSTLVHLATSPRLLEYRRDHPREDTDALRLGTAIHCAILEPEVWAARYVAKPDLGDGRTKAGKEARAAWRETLPLGAVVLDPEEHALASRAADAVRAHPDAARLVSHGRAEETTTWTDEATGIACKARLDYVTPSFVTDIKSTRQETLPDFARDVARRLYHGQFAFYLDGAIATKRVHDMAHFYVLGVQTVPPFDVMPCRMMLEDLERGRALYRSFLRRYAECRAANWYPGLAPSVVDLPLPEWAAAGEPEQTGDAW